jgi:hypothetical protein
MVLAALVLGTIGLLRGFGLLGDAAEQVGAEAGTVEFANEFSDALVWLLPAIAASLLATALHMNGHHRVRNDAMDKKEAGLYGFEHLLAMLTSLATVAAGALCILVGFDMFDRGNTVEDGILWGLGSIIFGGASIALHAVGHHQMVAEDYLVSIVERRAAGMPSTTTTTTRPAEGTSRR